jgi:hypothetical protein
MVAVGSLGYWGFREWFFKKAERWPAMVEVREAGGFFAGLLDSGELPGVAKGEKGQASLQSDFKGKGLVEFPLELVFEVEKVAEPNVKYLYTVRKETKVDRWKISRALRQAVGGKQVQIYPFSSEAAAR